MVTVEELATRVREATRQTPYLVTDTCDEGFTLRIDVGDPQWWPQMHHRSLSQVFTHVVRVDPGAGTYTVTDEAVPLEWRVEADGVGGIPRPVLLGSAVEAQAPSVGDGSGTEGEPTGPGETGASARYAFDSREGNRVIDHVAIPLGLRKKLRGTARVGLVVTLVSVIGLLVVGIVLGGLAVTGVL